MIDAIYTRQSVDRADSISIESQMEFCQYETRGGEYRYYSDRGFSGKNTDRPDFQRMMNDIKNGEIKRVIVYKLDRISRSILDFTSMMEEFHKYGVEFVSTTEKFDTSSPMGRAMLNICIVFAQLERETIQKRVADAYASRSKHGFFMGGPVPYGYSIEPYVIDGIKTSRYVISPEEAEVVRVIYQMYAQPQVSFGDIMRYLDDNKIRTRRGKGWNRTRIAEIVKNPIYLQADLDIYEFYKGQGTLIVNDPSEFIGANGCYLYETQEDKRKTLSLEGQTLVIAPHEGIVPSDIWLAARKKCLNNKNVGIPTKVKNSWLIGKAKCGKCGHALSIRFSKKNGVRYFMCGYHLNARGCDGFGTLRAPELEKFVLDAIRERLKSFETLTSSTESRVNPKLNGLRVKEHQLSEEMNTLLEKVIQADGALMSLINQRASDLDAQLKEVQKEIREITTATPATDVKTLTGYFSKWDELSIDDKRSVVDLVIAQVKATKDSVEIVWKI